MRKGLQLHRLCLLAATAAVLAGCASSSHGPLSHAQLIHALEERGLDPGKIVLPYDITPEMREWAEANLPKKGKPEDRLKGLIHALLSPDDGLGIQYERGFNGTAADVFRERKANCLSFTHLFVGMARAVGMKVYYLRVDDIQAYEKSGDLVIVSGHVTAGMGSARERTILEFTLAPEVDYHRVQPLDDLTAVALFYSNRGAQLLQRGEVKPALDWLNTAVRLDPDLPAAWVNRGVGLRRNGDLAAAEASYRRALQSDPQTVTAYQNLASLLRLEGRTDEAVELLALTDRLGTRNPFSYLSLGDLAMSRGRLDEARGYYKKALRLYRDHAEPYAALGLWEIAAGNPKEAGRWLHRAREIDPRADRVTLLASRLGEDVPPPTFAQLISSKKKGGSSGKTVPSGKRQKVDFPPSSGDGS